MKIVIRADANHAIGVGHFTRCMTLAREFLSANHTVEFQTACEIPELVQTAENHGINVVQISSDGSDSAPYLLQSETKYDWAILDGYHFTEAAQTAARHIADRLLVIDDAPREIGYSADLLLDQNYGAETQRYPTPDATQLLGTEYALIRPEITSLRDKSLSRTRDNISSITVTFGGSDPAGATGKIVEALANISNDTLQINVIAGPANSRGSISHNVTLLFESLASPIALMFQVVNHHPLPPPLYFHCWYL